MKTNSPFTKLGRSTRGVLAVAVTAGLLAACAAPPPAPNDQFYRLDVAADPGDQVLDGVVEVGRFDASGALGNRPLLYVDQGSNALTEYHYHFWVEAPPVLLQGALVSYLRGAGVAKQVVTPEMRARPAFTVTGRVIRLETVRGAPSKGVVALELSLRREGDGEILVLGEYSAEVPAGRSGIQTDVAALEKAVDDVFARFVSDIRAKASP